VKRLRYLVRINKDPDSDWGASVPDLPGCVATGKTIDSTLRRIQVLFNSISAECALRCSSSAPTSANCSAGPDITTGRLYRDRGGCRLRNLLASPVGGPPNKTHAADGAQGAPRLIRNVGQTNNGV